jgi:hypothetical protein
MSGFLVSPSGPSAERLAASISRSQNPNDPTKFLRRSGLQPWAQKLPSAPWLLIAGKIADVDAFPLDPALAPASIRIVVSQRQGDS